LVFNAAHGLTNDMQLIYTKAPGDSEVGGLVNGSSYYVKVIDTRTVTLSSTLGGAAIALNFKAANQVGHKLSYDSDPSATVTMVDVGFNPTVQDRYITLATAHGLIDNASITYSSGNSGAIGGLTSGASYVVSGVDSVAGTFELTAAAGGPALTLDFSLTSGIAHSFSSKSVIQAQHKFGDGQQVVYHTVNRAGAVDGGGASLFGLTEGATYTIDLLTSSSFRLLDSNDDVVDLDLAPANIIEGMQYKFSAADQIALDAPGSLVVGEAVRYVSGSHTDFDGVE
jgi:hypothetical protein